MNNLTQEELAEIVGIHPTYVGKLEMGKNNPSVKMLFKISRDLKITLADIFDFDRKKQITINCYINLTCKFNFI